MTPMTWNQRNIQKKYHISLPNYLSDFINDQVWKTIRCKTLINRPLQLKISPTACLHAPDHHLFQKLLTAEGDWYWWKWEISTCRTVGLLALECQKRLTKAGGGLGVCSAGSYVLLGKWLFSRPWKSLFDSLWSVAYADQSPHFLMGVTEISSTSSGESREHHSTPGNDTTLDWQGSLMLYCKIIKWKYWFISCGQTWQCLLLSNVK